MNDPERLNTTPPPPVEPENNAEQRAALERLQQGETAALLEFASSTLPKTERRKSRAIAKLITLFTLASTLVIEKHDPNAQASPESAELAALVGKNLAQPATKAELDALTQELIKGVMENSNTPHAGELIFGNVLACDDGGSYDVRKSERVAINENVRGELPEQAEKVVIRGGSISTTTEGQTNKVVSINSSTRSAFTLSGIAEGFDIVPVGEKLPFKGFGTSKKDALQNALDGAASFFGDEIKTDTSLKSETIDSAKGARFTENFNEHIQSLYGQAFHSYELATSKERPDGMWEVTVLAQPGRVIETEETEKEIIVKTPKG
ncbi:MAG: hypothetical protein Q7S86_04630 [bacterium]|nr:hypothetical protein [bacterium]